MPSNNTGATATRRNRCFASVIASSISRWTIKREGCAPICEAKTRGFCRSILIEIAAQETRRTRIALSRLLVEEGSAKKSLTDILENYAQIVSEAGAPFQLVRKCSRLTGCFFQIFTDQNNGISNIHITPFVIL